MRITVCGWIMMALAAIAADPDAGQAKDPPVTAARRGQDRYEKDPLAVRSLDPVFDTFPDSSLVDFSFLLDPPAGKHGFVEADGHGQFRFSGSGQRARFWGVTVAANHVGDIEKRRIELVVDVLARGGCNLLRLHELDNRGAEKYNLVRRNIIDEAYPNNDRSTAFDAEYRDRVDYWIHCAQRRGMYVYLVLRGYRTFRAGDGVANAGQLDRSAKPYAFFDSRLIELQKQYADEWLFRHVNPYTGKANGLNPAVGIIEIENEDSLFFGHVAWREFAEPYRTEFRRMWNEWLRGKYGSTEGLRRAWTNDRGECALAGEERLEAGSVDLPSMTLRPVHQLASVSWTDPTDSPARSSDGVHFAVDVQRRYFATMRDFLRQRGSRVPLNAVVHGGVPADTWSAARELDSTAENCYLDHPSFQPGALWVGKQLFRNSNYLRGAGPESLAAQMARYRWAGVPLVCREWTLCWPNMYRVCAMPDMAAQAAMQDYDAIIHFAYYTWGNTDTISAFGPQCDPARWGLNGYAAMLYLTGAVPAESRRVQIVQSNEDLSTWASCYGPLQGIAWTHRLENWNPDDSPDRDGVPSKDVLLRVTSGRSGTGAYRGNRFVLYDARYSERMKMGPEKRAQGVLSRSGYDAPWVYREAAFPVQEVETAGYQPILRDRATSMCLGFVDPKRQNVVLASVSESTATAVAREYAASLEAGRTEHILTGVDSELLVASDGRVRRDCTDGVLTIATDRVCALSGELKPGMDYRAGALTISTSSPIATVMAVSLDGKPLGSSRRFAVKMATGARNRGQILEKVAAQDPEGAQYMLSAEGGPPVQTGGIACAVPTVVRLAGEPVVESYLMNGTWEIVVDRDKASCALACDTPNIRFAVSPEILGADKGGEVAIRKYFTEYPPADAGQRSCDFVYPGFAKYVSLAAVSRSE